jgi:hypothetical protein
MTTWMCPECDHTFISEGLCTDCEIQTVTCDTCDGSGLIECGNGDGSQTWMDACTCYAGQVMTYKAERERAKDDALGRRWA